jgi:hypothetical protein
LLKADATLPQFTYFALISFTGLFATYKLAGHLGSAAEDDVDRWNPISYVQLTAGDKKQIADLKSANKMTVLAVIGNLVGSFIVAVAARVGAHWLSSTPI